MIKFLKKRKHNNTGFTMVELIIAVAILGIVTVPIVSSMAQTARINAKSRAMQKATDLAQNLMEGIREYTMQEVIDQCITPNDFSLIYSSIISYEPTTYEFIDASSTSTFQEQLQKATIDNSYIYGEINTESTSADEDDYNGETDPAEETTASTSSGGTVYAAYDGSSYDFAFCNIYYNKSYFDAIVSFEKYVPKGEEALPYYVYEVTVTIYNSKTTERFSDSERITSLSGAVQNQ